jgi:hypothetical protein
MIAEMGVKIKNKMCYAHIKGCQYCTYSIRDGQIFWRFEGFKKRSRQRQVGCSVAAAGTNG